MVNKHLTANSWGRRNFQAIQRARKDASRSRSFKTDMKGNIRETRVKREIKNCHVKARK